MAHAISRVLAEYDAVQTPLITGLDFGHTDPMAVLPCGILAEIDCNNTTLSLLESAVIKPQGTAESSAQEQCSAGH